MNRLAIFLSSTKEDLSETREEIQRFLSVLKSDMLSMELFGSDESLPLDYCLQQIDRCNIFIGVYAERYGTIDPDTGLSITELEYRRASERLQEGRLVGLLLYVLHKEASWHIKWVDRDSEKASKLKNFKEILSQKHTVTYFMNAEELPLKILRDVIRKIALGTKGLFQTRDTVQPTSVTTLARPLGMEYYTEEYSPLFRGRSDETDDLLKQIMKNRISLLIGSSGVGKTSLVNAGLAPRLREFGWRVAIVRPLGEPSTTLKASLWSQLLEGAPPDEFDFSSVVHSVSMAYDPTHTLVVIDQFEDVLTCAGPERDYVLRSLLQFHRSSDSNTKLLIAYRGDVEAELGPMWQKVAGSVEGLPRTYLDSLKDKGCREALAANFQALGIKVDAHLVDQITKDLYDESSVAGFSGVYPPFLQMVISKVASDVGSDGVHANSGYWSAGRARTIIADYLMSQLKYLGEYESLGREVLTSLVNASGKRNRKSVREIVRDTLEDHRPVESALERLVELRLVRGLDGRYEIVHDYLAKTIVTQLIQPEEMEAKKFKDLLSSRAHAFKDTGSGLISREHLYIYKYRSRMLCTDDEIKMLFLSYLKGNGPAWYWLRSIQKKTIATWLAEFVAENLESDDADALVRAATTMADMGERVVVNQMAKKLQKRREFANLISRFATREDIKCLRGLSRSYYTQIRSASLRALVRLVRQSDHELLRGLYAARSEDGQELFRWIALSLGSRSGLASIQKRLKSRSAYEKAIGLYGLGAKGTNSDIPYLQEQLSNNKTPVRLRWICRESMARIRARLDGPEGVLELLADPQMAEAVLRTIERPMTGLRLEDVVRAFRRVSPGRRLLVPVRVATASGDSDYEILQGPDGLTMPAIEAISNMASRHDRHFIKTLLKDIPAYDHVKGDLVLTLCRIGQAEDFSFLLGYIMDAKAPLEFGDNSYVLSVIAGLATRSHLRKLRSLIESHEFWQYFRANNRPVDRLPVKCFYNIQYVRRLVGEAYANIAGPAEIPTLRRLLGHWYWTVWSASARAIVRLGKPEDIEGLNETALADFGNTDARSLVEALDGLDQKFYRPSSLTP